MYLLFQTVKYLSTNTNQFCFPITVIVFQFPVITAPDYSPGWITEALEVSLSRGYGSRRDSLWIYGQAG